MAENETPSERTENNAIINPVDEPTAETVDTTPKVGDTPNGALGNAVEEKKEIVNSGTGDISDAGLVKTHSGLFKLTKHGLVSICPFKPERYSHLHDNDGKITQTQIIVPECTSFCPMFSLAKDGGNYIASISCGCESIKYTVPEDKLIIAEPPKPVGNQKKEGIIRSIK